jgi:hypothetical protein
MTHSRYVVAATLVSVALVLPGCGTRDTEVVKVVDWKVPTWEGCTREEVVAVWHQRLTSGRRPSNTSAFDRTAMTSERQPDESEVLTFYVTKFVKGGPAGGNIPPSKLKDGTMLEGGPDEPTIVPGLPDIEERLEVAEFRLDKNNIVERYRIDPAHVSPGRFEPPETCQKRVRKQRGSLDGTER